MTTAVVTMECQRGVIGDLATFPALATAVAESGLVAALERLVAAARAHGIVVAHAMFEFSRDPSLHPTNAPLLRYAGQIPGQLCEGTDAVALIPELRPEPTDLISRRRHGVSPFIGTDLDRELRGAGVDTIVACGASLNVGVLGLCIEAVNLGYEVVMPLDATVAVPPSFGTELVVNTYRQLVTLTTVDELIAEWAR